MIGALALNQLLSSGTHLIAKGALIALGPLTTALLRFLLASGTLAAVHWLRRGSDIHREDRPRALLLGVLAVPINQGFFLFGLMRSTPSHASLLYALTPIVVLVLARGLLREGNLAGKLAGMVAAFAGVVLILLDGGLERRFDVLMGDLLILVAVFAWALYTVLSKPLMGRYEALTVNAWTIVPGTILCLPALAIPGAIPPLATIGIPVWAGIAYLAIGTSVIAYPLWLYALRYLDASKVAVTANLQPVLTGILSWIIFRETFTPRFMVGAALVLAGVTWVETRRAQS